MNVLIRFEDRYGCCTLFNYSSSVLHGVANIVNNLGDDGVFNVFKRDANEYDYIVLVFDLDEQVKMSLTSEILHKKLKKYIMNNNGDIKESYANKIVLIPVFFCYETLYLFLPQLQNIIKNIDSYGNSQAKELIKIYKKYYDYSKINPELLFNAAKNLESIKDDVAELTEQKSKEKWLPQKIYLSYSKQLLKMKYHDILKQYNYSDKIYEKDEDNLFETLKKYNCSFDVNDMISAICSQYIYNYWINRLLSMSSCEELKELTLENTLHNIDEALDAYNNIINGITSRTINECISNIESMLQFSNIKDDKTIIDACKTSGYTEDEITIAMDIIKSS